MTTPGQSQSSPDDTNGSGKGSFFRDDYILDAINQDFPLAKLQTSDVIGTWAGLRPLIADHRGNPSDISRRHHIEMSHPGWWDVTGGKLTTYRLMGEETVDAVLEYLNLYVTPSPTARVSLLSDEQRTGNSGILPPKVSQEIVRDNCQNEWARHLDDVMIRRTSWRCYHRDHLEIAGQVTRWMQNELHWSTERAEAELRRYQELTKTLENSSSEEKSSKRDP